MLLRKYLHIGCVESQVILRKWTSIDKFIDTFSKLVDKVCNFPFDFGDDKQFTPVDVEGQSKCSVKDDNGNIDFEAQRDQLEVSSQCPGNVYI